MSRVKLNVSGTNFEFERRILQEGKSPKLTKICSGSSELDKPLEVTVDCSPSGFGAILSYYQSGELHIPPGVCPGAFRRELSFWEVDFDSLHECCMFRYHAFLDEEATRKQFLHKALSPSAIVAPAFTPPAAGFMQRCRTKVWNVIDNNENSLPAKLYFIFISALVVVSVFVLAYSTEPSMRRPVSKCELIDYLESIHYKNIEMVKSILGHPDCSNPGSWLGPGDWDHDEMFDVADYNWSFYEYSWGWQLPSSANGNISPPQDNSSKRGKGSMPPEPDNEQPEGDPGGNEQKTEEPTQKAINIPKLTVPKPVFNIVDTVVNVVFTFDFILRILSCPSVWGYFLSVINVLDALALLSSYIYIIIVSVERRYFYENTPWLSMLEFAQVFRALRLFRVVKNVRASKVLAYSLTQDVRDMSLLVTLLFVGVSTFAYLFYFAEPRNTVISIPNAWYWAIVTMTTVGYGDISPESGFGRVIASLCAVSGVLLLSITLPMFVNNFLTYYQYSCVNESIEKRKKEKQTETPVKEMKDAENEANDNHVYISDLTDIDRPPSYETFPKSRETIRVNVKESSNMQGLTSYRHNYSSYGDFPASMVEEDPRCPSVHYFITGGYLGRTTDLDDFLT